jgi:hypothetical protein
MNRETWLKQLADRAIPYIAGRFNYTEEEVAVRLSCGFPATQGKRKKVTASLIPPTNSDEFRGRGGACRAPSPRCRGHR